MNALIRPLVYIMGTCILLCACRTPHATSMMELRPSDKTGRLTDTLTVDSQLHLRYTTGDSAVSIGVITEARSAEGLEYLRASKHEPSSANVKEGAEMRSAELSAVGSSHELDRRRTTTINILAGWGVVVLVVILIAIFQ